MKRTKALAMISILAAVVTVLSACGTVRGFGSDVSKTGNAITSAASR